MARKKSTVSSPTQAPQKKLQDTEYKRGSDDFDFIEEEIVRMLASNQKRSVSFDTMQLTDHTKREVIEHFAIIFIVFMTLRKNST